jgi:hypothetical protein
MMWVYSSGSQYGPKKKEEGEEKSMREMEETINGILQKRAQIE